MLDPRIHPAARSRKAKKFFGAVGVAHFRRSKGSQVESSLYELPHNETAAQRSIKELQVLFIQIERSGKQAAP